MTDHRSEHDTTSVSDTDPGVNPTVGGGMEGETWLSDGFYIAALVCVGVGAILLIAGFIRLVVWLVTSRKSKALDKKRQRHLEHMRHLEEYSAKGGGSSPNHLHIETGPVEGAGGEGPANRDSAVFHWDEGLVNAGYITEDTLERHSPKEPKLSAHITGSRPSSFYSQRGVRVSRTQSDTRSHTQPDTHSQGTHTQPDARPQGAGNGRLPQAPNIHQEQSRTEIPGQEVDRDRPAPIAGSDSKAQHLHKISGQLRPDGHVSSPPTIVTPNMDTRASNGLLAIGQPTDVRPDDIKLYENVSTRSDRPAPSPTDNNNVQKTVNGNTAHSDRLADVPV